MFIPELEYENTFLGLKHGKEGVIGLQFFDKSKYLKKNLSTSITQASWKDEKLKLAGSLRSFGTQFCDFEMSLVLVGSGKNSDLVFEIKDFKTETKDDEDGRVVSWKATLNPEEFKDFIIQTNKNVNFGFSMRLSSGNAKSDYRIGCDPKGEYANKECLVSFMSGEVFEADNWIVVPYLTNKGSFSIKVSKKNNLFKDITFSDLEIKGSDAIFKGALSSALVQRKEIKFALLLAGENNSKILLPFTEFKQKKEEVSTVNWTASISKHNLTKLLLKNVKKKINAKLNYEISGKSLTIPLKVICSREFRKSVKNAPLPFKKLDTHF